MDNSYEIKAKLSNGVLAVKDGGLVIGFGRDDHTCFSQKPAIFCSAEYFLRIVNGGIGYLRPFKIHQPNVPLNLDDWEIIDMRNESRRIYLTKEDIDMIKKEFGILAHETADYQSALSAMEKHIGG